MICKMTPLLILLLIGQAVSQTSINDIDHLEFKPNQMTRADRKLNVPQLNPASLSLARLNSSVTCYRDGLRIKRAKRPEQQIVWKCQSSGNYSISVLSIDCEGYRTEDGAVILDGSCYLTYRASEIQPSDSCGGPVAPILTIVFLLFALWVFWGIHLFAGQPIV